MKNFFIMAFSAILLISSSCKEEEKTLPDELHGRFMRTTPLGEGILYTYYIDERPQEEEFVYERDVSNIPFEELTFKLIPIQNRFCWSSPYRPIYPK